MKFNKKRIKDRLANVPLDKQVWVYSAEIIIEFLNHTFLPTRHFLTTAGSIEAKTQDIKPSHFVRSLCYKEERFSISEIYELYLSFREKRDYTSEIETKYTLSVILSKCLYRKNGWEFIKTRYSREQLTMFGPLARRGSVSSEIRKEYPVKKADLEGSEVEVKFKDLQSDEPEDDKDKVLSRDEVIVETLNNGCSVEYSKKEREWTEAVEFKWVETE